MANHPEILLRCTSDLTVHPAARELPQLADDDPQLIALLDDIRAHGIQSPLEINKHNQIVDGRHRWRAAKKLNLKDVPVMVHDDGEVIAIILRSLLLRRHYTKSALAYTAHPMLRAAYEEARDNPGQPGAHSVRNPFT